MRPGIHFANLRTSKRLQRVLKALRQAGRRGLTTWGIISKAMVCAVNSCISELRRNGYQITCKREAENVFRYRLAK